MAGRWAGGLAGGRAYPKWRQTEDSAQYFSLLWPIDTKLAVWVAYIKRQLGSATQVSVIKVKVTVTKIEIQFPLNNFNLLLPFDTKLSVWVAYIKTQLGIAT